MSSNLFDELADELVVKILEYMHWKFDLNVRLNPDIHNLSLCNRRLRRIALPQLYRTVHVSYSKRINQFLRAIVDSPTHAGLVKEIALGWNERKFRPCSKVEQAKFIDMAKSRSLPTNFVSLIERQEPSANIFLLLHLLQDLRVLQITAWDQIDTTFENLLAEFFNRGFLSKSLSVFIRNGEEESKGLDVGLLLPAFMLPNMTEIYASMLFSDEDLKEHWSLPGKTELSSYYRKSSVEKLEITSNNLLISDFDLLLRLPRTLRTLTYRGDSYRSIGPSLGRFRSALDRVSDSLEFLDIRWTLENFSGIRALWSFNNFSSLRVLCIDYMVLYGLDPKVAPRIVGSLPPRLEALGLHTPKYINIWTSTDFIDCWRRILIEKLAGALIHLRLIAHLQDMALLSPLLDLANMQGVQIAQDQKEFDL
jgi:hypothetical protein